MFTHILEQCIRSDQDRALAHSTPYNRHLFGAWLLVEPLDPDKETLIDYVRRKMGEYGIMRSEPLQSASAPARAPLAQSLATSLEPMSALVEASRSMQSAGSGHATSLTSTYRSDNDDRPLVSEQQRNLAVCPQRPEQASASDALAQTTIRDQTHARSQDRTRDARLQDRNDGKPLMQPVPAYPSPASPTLAEQELYTQVKTADTSTTVQSALAKIAPKSVPIESGPYEAVMRASSQVPPDENVAPASSFSASRMYDVDQDSSDDDKPLPRQRPAVTRHLTPPVSVLAPPLTSPPRATRRPSPAQESTARKASPSLMETMRGQPTIRSAADIAAAVASRLNSYMPVSVVGIASPTSVRPSSHLLETSQSTVQRPVELSRLAEPIPKPIIQDAQPIIQDAQNVATADSLNGLLSRSIAAPSEPPIASFPASDSYGIDPILPPTLAPKPIASTSRSTPTPPAECGTQPVNGLPLAIDAPEPPIIASKRPRSPSPTTVSEPAAKRPSKKALEKRIAKTQMADTSSPLLSVAIATAPLQPEPFVKTSETRWQSLKPDLEALIDKDGVSKRPATTAKKLRDFLVAQLEEVKSPDGQLLRYSLDFIPLKDRDRLVSEIGKKGHASFYAAWQPEAGKPDELLAGPKILNALLWTEIYNRNADGNMRPIFEHVWNEFTLRCKFRSTAQVQQLATGGLIVKLMEVLKSDRAIKMTKIQSGLFKKYRQGMKDFRTTVDKLFAGESNGARSDGQRLQTELKMDEEDGSKSNGDSVKMTKVSSTAQKRKADQPNNTPVASTSAAKLPTIKKKPTVVEPVNKLEEILRLQRSQRREETDAGQEMPNKKVKLAKRVRWAPDDKLEQIQIFRSEEPYEIAVNPAQQDAGPGVPEDDPIFAMPEGKVLKQQHQMEAAAEAKQADAEAKEEAEQATPADAAHKEHLRQELAQEVGRQNAVIDEVDGQRKIVALGQDLAILWVEPQNVLVSEAVIESWESVLTEDSGIQESVYQEAREATTPALEYHYGDAVAPSAQEPRDGPANPGAAPTREMSLGPELLALPEIGRQLQRARASMKAAATAQARLPTPRALQPARATSPPNATRDTTAANRRDRNERTQSPESRFVPRIDVAHPVGPHDRERDQTSWSHDRGSYVAGRSLQDRQASRPDAYSHYPRQ
ncbi:uncharacterized protein L969DRAFT_616628 [Mixia osmundae IAM 14324]|uniref:Uncharacterized protein n=1 Tax=Mixia osmundae (strain CBS 9802 / IAM 14324 / JCM 22182 / KY 12970) TaxID=764103 RepID=G7E678_MIXOS|nr:uncharacterized protein L969DRAFT_616628 [Mixia osmundae IAM 14324]KEI40508.1 hypothetical protein L969DRAFT_616628 [Mixia osmundae IAM 14324]GAA98338.1 hypothetical protein E5Q_05023 [Mixia osmundae IAM 14324]